MADELLTEQQQAENVKHWVQQNGLVLAAGVVLGLGLLFGVNQWRNYQERHAEQASDVYESLLQAVRSNQVSQAETGLATLTADYGSTPYTDLARMSVAHLYLEQGQADQAAELLRKVVDSAATTEIQLIARLRLARVLNQQEKFDEALKVLTDPKSAAYAPAYHDVRGDVYFAMGKFDEARSQYEQALHGDDAAVVIDRAYVEAKLDDLGGALTPEVTPEMASKVTSDIKAEK
ncbi:MAG: tetratricopeptide repeat protein [Gammaproteobacteria bacterium]